ncbi:hypothetical protein ACFXI8_26795 [Streptomyces niveus]|uniref:hypothetical protein n=1 Tax=Streptomyces niveus TaxID=193462 RepID=UPI00368EC2F7
MTRHKAPLPIGLLSVILAGIHQTCAVGTLNVGGDIESAERLILSGTATGVCQPGKALKRSDARPDVTTHRTSTLEPGAAPNALGLFSGLAPIAVAALPDDARNTPAHQVTMTVIPATPVTDSPAGKAATNNSTTAARPVLEPCALGAPVLRGHLAGFSQGTAGFVLSGGTR